MEKDLGGPPGASSDILCAKELVGLVAQKLSSQVLLFSLAVIVILAVIGALVSPWLAGAILVVFVVGTAGYLFVEQKGKVVRGDQETMSRLLGQKMRAIRKPAGELAVRAWTTPASGGTAKDIQVVPTGKSATYHIGDKINVLFQASQDCYLTLLNVGTSGRLAILFPNTLHQDNFIRADQVYQIPGTEYGFEYQLREPPGVERLKAIATLEQVSLLAEQFAPDGSLFRSEAPTAAARDIAMVQRKVEALSSQRWAEDTWEFRVVR